MKTRILLSAGLLAGALLGCGQTSGGANPFVAATPDAAGLTLETSGTDESLVAAGATSPLALTEAVATGATTCAPYQDLCNIHRVISGLNGFTEELLDQVQALAALPPTVVSPTEELFGPVNLPATNPVATFRLTVVEETPMAAAAATPEGTFRWKLEGKPLGAPDTSYAILAAGVMHRAPTDLVHRGHGVIGVDLDALTALNPAPVTSASPFGDAAGKLLIGYRHTGVAKSVVYFLSNFTPDQATQPALADAYVAGWKDALGEARVRIASVGEYVPPPTGTTDAGKELIEARARWLPGVGGRALVAVAGGDVPSYGVDFFLGVSCYDKAEAQLYRGWFGCKLGMGCTLVPGMPAGWDVGAPTACLAGTELPYDDATPPPAPATDATTNASPPQGAPTGMGAADAPPAGMAAVAF